MQDIDYASLFAKADKNIADSKKDLIKSLALDDEEKFMRTEKFANSIQSMLIDILTKAQATSGNVVEIDGLQDYGTPEKVGWKLDDEGLEVKLDFSYKYFGTSCPKGEGFDYYNEISWEYLEQVLKEHNIQISRRLEIKVDKGNRWYEISLTTCTDLITITLGRPKNNNNESVLEEKGTQK